MSALPNAPTRESIATEVERTLHLLMEPGAVFEIRVPRTPSQGTVSGYYTDVAKCARDVAQRLDGKAPAVYVTPNPVMPDVAARAFNRLKPRVDVTTQDSEIVRRRWLLIDPDPVRPTGISATEAEHAEALERAELVAEFLTSEGWPEPIRADSGNGGHLLYRIDLPNDKESAVLVAGVLSALATVFDDDQVKIDTSVANAARIWKLYPTLVRKGDSTPERPHRRSRLLSAPELPEVVTREVLGALCEELREETPSQASQQQSPGSHGPHWIEDAGDYLRAQGVAVASERAATNARKWVLEACVWNPDHTDHSAWVMQFTSNGAIAAGCSHNSCQGKRWPDFRDAVEPGWRAGERGQRQNGPEWAHWEYQERREENKSTGAKPTHRLKLQRVSEIRAERITWLWRGYVPLGELSLLVAGGGVGKTRINFELAVRVAAGLPLPDGSWSCLGVGPAGVLIVTSENDPAKIVRPQLEATARHLLGNDAAKVKDCLDHIFVVEGVEFKAACKEKGIKLTIFDPLISYTSADIKVIDQLDVRRFLDPLAATARELEMAILATIHFSKRADGEFVNRVSGSRQYTDTARSVLSVLVGGQEEDGMIRRWLASAKLNLGKTPPAWSFFVETVEHPAFDDEKVGIIRWDYARDGLDADELERELQAARESAHHGWEAAADELRRRLVGLWMSTPRPQSVTASQLETWRGEIDVSDKTWTKAKNAVGIKTRATARGGEWAARLDEVPFLQGYKPPTSD